MRQPALKAIRLALTDVKRLLKSRPHRIRDTEREVLNYNKALKTIHSRIKKKRLKLNVATLEHIQGLVVDGLMDNPADIGYLRKKPVVIRDPRAPDSVTFIPPNHKDVPQLTRALFEFVNKGIGQIDPIVLAGLFHRQCVIIHPFMDSNGRTTRIMTTAILGEGGLDIFEIFSFENYYNRNITRYFKEVGLVGDYYDVVHKIDFTSWLEYFADGIIDELKRVQKLIRADTLIRLDDHLKTLLSYLDEHGSIQPAQSPGQTSHRWLLRSRSRKAA